MKINEIRGMTTEELNAKFISSKTELFNLRFQHATGNLNNPMMLSTLKKDIAKIKTILTERQLGINQEATEKAVKKAVKTAAKTEKAAVAPKAKIAEKPAKAEVKKTVAKPAKTTKAETAKKTANAVKTTVAAAGKKPAKGA